jgi:HSP20 family protein
MNEDKDGNRKVRNNRSMDDFFNQFFNDSFYQSSSDIFNIFEERIRQMHKEMNKINQLSTQSHNNQQTENKPFVYGWSYYQGPDGVPHYQEFSNANELPPEENEKLPSGRNEPFIDVIEAEKEIYITAEIPGVDKETIDVELAKDTIIIKVNHPERGFAKEINLPAEVGKKPVEATYNNGVLSITLKKQKTKKKGNKINIK